MRRLTPLLVIEMIDRIIPATAPVLPLGSRPGFDRGCRPDGVRSGRIDDDSERSPDDPPRSGGDCIGENWKIGVSCRGFWAVELVNAGMHPVGRRALEDSGSVRTSVVTAWSAAGSLVIDITVRVSRLAVPDSLNGLKTVITIS